MMIELTSEVQKDAATAFTLRYLDLIDKTMPITYSSQGEPICVIEEIIPSTVSALIAGLTELFSSELAASAIESSKFFGRNHIQSVGFGNVSDLDAFLKIGFLFSERVVLWDILLSKILRTDHVRPELPSVIADISCNLLLLRSVVERGGVVILPHPLSWSEKARQVHASSFIDNSPSSVALGLISALSAIDEGISLHPYTLTTMPYVGTVSVNEDERRYMVGSEGQFSYGMVSLMSHNDFEFLRDIPIARFFEITANNPGIYRALRAKFATMVGLSSVQSAREMDEIAKELQKLIVARDRSVANYWVDGMLATGGVVTGGLTVAASPLGATFLALLGLAPGAANAVKRFLSKPAGDVIVQSFAAFRSAEPFKVEYTTAIPDTIEVSGHGDTAELACHIASIEAEHWTEDAHRYLESLDESTALAVLNALLPEQMHNLVNYRSRQEDYIGDYLEFVWDSSPESFWGHINESFKSEEGMVMYDGFAVHQVLISNDMPIAVWATLLLYLPSIYRDILRNNKPHDYKEESGQHIVDFQVTQLSEVFSYQLLESYSSKKKLVIFLLWIAGLSEDDRFTVDILLRKTFPSGFLDIFNTGKG